ncbi:MAG: PEP-CTERM sorting domain-containing protein, partial [Burkholderiaceae bacterium]|nr:PEP-CTERM sorting domain-containing protein [Burkholderiaceae bacterium]
QTASADWLQHRLDFTALSSSTIVSIVGESAGGNGLALQLDAVSVVASAVPEPATAATLLAGLAAVLATRRRVAGSAGMASARDEDAAAARGQPRSPDAGPTAGASITA